MTVRTAFEQEVMGRFGILPNFFRSAPEAPELIERLWAYAKAGYLDNPLPALFKERLFVYVSRFCPIRYCLVRHVGFLMGKGRPSGDSGARPHDLAAVLRLLRRPVPSNKEIPGILSRLEALPAPLIDWPEPESRDEDVMLAASVLLFLEPVRSQDLLPCLRRLLGASLEYLLGFLSFVRTAHYWTVTHPTIAIEDDMLELMGAEEELRALLLDDPESDRWDPRARLLEEIADLREERRGQRRVERALKDAFERAVASAPLETALDELTRAAQEASSAESVIFLFGDDSSSVRIAGSAGLSDSHARAIEEDPTLRSWSETAVLRRATPERGEEHGPFQLSFVDAEAEEGMQACWVFPIRQVGGRIVGTFVLCPSDVREPNASDVEVGRALAEAAALLIDRYQMDAQRRIAEHAAQRRTQEFETLLHRAPLGVYVIDESFRIVEVNPAALPVFGNIPNLIGRDFTEVIHALWSQPYADELVDLFRHTLDTGEPFVTSGRIEERRDRGVTEAYEWSIHRIPRPDDRWGVVCYFRDISVEVKARQVISESEERYRSLVGVITDISWTANAEGSWVSAEAAWERYTEQSEDQARGFGWLHAIHPEDREAVAEAWRRSCASQTEYESFGRLWHASSGQHRYFESRATPLLHEDGRVREWVGTFADIHARRVAEEELKEANRRKDEFLAVLAHELRNPLAPMRNALQILSKPGADARLAEKSRQMLDRQLEHLVRLVDDLLELSRITRGALDLRKEPLEISTVVAAALDTCLLSMDRSSHDFGVSLPDEPLHVLGDSTRLEQVLSNLLQNAAKYTPRGGRIALDVRRDENQVVLRVTDTGVGIPKDMLERIFEMFQQVDHSTEYARGGLGIGLNLAQRLMEMHGGSIEAYSDGPGTGSEFVVRMPLATEFDHPSLPQLNPPPAAPLLPRRRVLVVDDNRDSADSLAALLNLEGHHVEVAYDGKEALQTARRVVPEIILLDLGLPGIDGYEVARSIRTDARLKDALLIAQTGWGQALDRQRTHEAGFDGHLVKPIDPDVVMSLVARGGMQKS